MSFVGPSAMSFESRVRTPAVPFGDKFEVVTRYVLVKEGPQKVCLTPLHSLSLSWSTMYLLVLVYHAPLIDGLIDWLG